MFYAHDPRPTKTCELRAGVMRRGVRYKSALGPRVPGFCDLVFCGLLSKVEPASTKHMRRLAGAYKRPPCPHSWPRVPDKFGPSATEWTWLQCRQWPNRPLLRTLARCVVVHHSSERPGPQSFALGTALACGGAWVTLAKHEHVLVRLRHLAARLELLRHAHGRSAYHSD